MFGAAQINNKEALDALLGDPHAYEHGVLAILVGVVGHAFSPAGTFMYFNSASERCGWISPGCIEAELARAAKAARSDGLARVLALDNLDMSDVFSGAGSGCRGQQIVVVLPLNAATETKAFFQTFRDGIGPLKMTISHTGEMDLHCGAHAHHAQLKFDRQMIDAASWSFTLAPLPQILICGAGPETEILVPLLNKLGWRTDLFETRAAWQASAALAERHLMSLPRDGAVYQAVIVMAHHFDHDLAALSAIAAWPTCPRYIGLLGPKTRKSDLLNTLSEAERQRLEPRLESPAGIHLGGRGAAAIALSLAARLQVLLHRPNYDNAPIA